ncbi:hypothetical protein FLBR109950_05375 [Flavobacterium branchiophilum]
MLNKIALEIAPFLGIPQGSDYPFQTTFIELQMKYNIVK